MRRRNGICPQCYRLTFVFPSMRDGYYVFRLHQTPDGRVCRGNAAIPEDETEVA